MEWRFIRQFPEYGMTTLFADGAGIVLETDAEVIEVQDEALKSVIDDSKGFLGPEIGPLPSSEMFKRSMALKKKGLWLLKIIMQCQYCC